MLSAPDCRSRLVASPAPRHGKPGVRLAELRVSAPQVLSVSMLDLLLSVDLLVERLAADRAS
jgi:hypothetical protein